MPRLLCGIQPWAFISRGGDLISSGPGLVYLLSESDKKRGRKYMKKESLLDRYFFMMLSSRHLQSLPDGPATAETTLTSR